jgi:LysM repeat protein
MQKNFRDPRFLGFLIGFSIVALIGLIAIASWVILAGSPAPTLVPTAAPIVERDTTPPTSESGPGTAPPSSERPGTPSPSPAPTEPLPTPTRSEPIEHTVSEGDTLFTIALAYDVSVETIQEANALSGETILPGQVLLIPPGPLPTPTPYVEGGVIIHTVATGQTLIGIAETYSVSVGAIQAANQLDSEIILPGQKLRIPAGGRRPEPIEATRPEPVEGTRPEPVEGDESPTPAASATPSDKPWEPSILEGNLAAAYPLTRETERFTMHYQPDTPADRAPNQMVRIVESALNHIEQKLQVTMKEPFDVYIAGSLFAPDDTALRGRSFSSQRRNFYLHDDSGTPEERKYLITHELTHLVIWNTVGRPSSVMLHEGVAVHNGIEAMEEAGFFPLQHFCAAYHQAGQLPSLTGGRSYLGHIRDLDLYFTAGCFVSYLIDEYGIADFKQLFTSGDYRGIYGLTLSQLEAQWIETLDTVADDLAFDPEDLVASVAGVTAAYDRLFGAFSGTPAEMAAYRELDHARIAMLEGRFEDAQGHLGEFEDRLVGD